MAVVTPAQARAHLRLASDYPEDQITPYLAAAVDAAAEYLNRTIYADEAAEGAALQAMPGNLGQASTAHAAALAAAAEIASDVEKAATIQVANKRLAAANHQANRDLHGLQWNASIHSAVLLILGHLFSNREDVVVGATVSDIPQGSRTLLRPYRRVMMP